MADTSRKRSRKSKLVPRECAVDEGDLELQVPPLKIFKCMKQNTSRQPTKKVVKPPEPIISEPEVCDTSVLKKINASAKEDSEPQSKKSPRKFEINIEVESCDDDDEFAGVAMHTESIIAPKVRTEPIALSRESILEAAENILRTSTNVADKILNVHVRNTIAHEEKSILVPHWQEKKIQHTLNEWRSWQFRSFHREDPLFYKCYLCTKSWWHLTDFRDHLSKEHADEFGITIALEKYDLHEANLIAYYKRITVVRDIYTDGLCYRCGKDYSSHELGQRFQGKFYKSSGCTKHFYSCMGLRDHFSTCPVCNNQDKPFKCDICKCRFDTVQELINHLVLSHSVRSDIPIMAHYKNCRRCSERYSCQYLHKCVQKGPHVECPHCLQCFSNVMSLEIHMERSSKPHKCEVCQAVMMFSCKKYEHMLEHTDKYMIVRKCATCEGLNAFMNNEDAMAHWSLKHEELRDMRHFSYFPKMLVPSTCVYQSLAESKSDEQKLSSEEQESLLVEQKSLPEEFIPEEKFTIPHEEESVPDEEKYVPKDKKSASKEKEFVSKSDSKSASVYEQKLLQAELKSATEFLLGAAVKDEPEDSEDTPQYSPRLVIKEEIFEEFENQMHEEENLTEKFEHEVSVKEENIEEEYDEYEEDIIKLNFLDLLVKQEPIQEDDNCTLERSEENQESEDNDDSEEFPQQQDSMLEPQVIIEGDNKKNRKLYKCTKCGFTAKHKQYRNHIEYDCGANPVTQKIYSCTKCVKAFVTMKKYLSHFKEHGYQHLCCPECLKEFGTFSSLGQHLALHVKHNFVRVKLITHDGKAMTKPDYQCKKCGEIIKIHNFFEHWELHINAQPTHAIKVTSRPAQLHTHETLIKECIASLNKQPKQCSHCHRWFKRVNECKRHIIEHLLADAYRHKPTYKELKCQVCDQGFAVPEKYKQHMRDHASLPVYKCQLCDRTFSDSSNFTKHKKVHNLKVIVCDLCGKKFQSKLSLEKHLEMHKNADPITCKVCNKIFHFDSSYRRHVRGFHEKPVHGYRCVMCGQRFDSLRLKWDHMWYVHKERKQKADCPICNKSFRKYSDVRRHARENHLTAVSVLNIKKNAHPNLDIDKYLKDPAKIKLGRMETLVVYDSD